MRSPFLIAIAIVLAACESPEAAPALVGDEGLVVDAAAAPDDTTADIAEATAAPADAADAALADSAPGGQDTAPDATTPADVAPDTPPALDTAPDLITSADAAAADTTAPADVLVPPKPKTCTVDNGQAVGLDPDELGPKLATSLPALPVAVAVAEEPLLGHGVEVRGQQVFAVDRLNGQLVVVDRGPLAVARKVAVGARPERIAVDCQGNAWVTVRGPGLLARVAPTDTATPAQAWPLGREPVGLLLRAAPGGCQPVEAIVALTGELAVAAFALPSGQELWRVPTTRPPHDVFRDGEHLVVLQPGSPPLRLVLPPAGQATTAPAVTKVALRTLNPAHKFAIGVNQPVAPLVAAHAVAAAPGLKSGDVLVLHQLASLGDEAALLPQPVPPPCTGYGCSLVTSGPPPDPCARLPVRPLETTVTRVVAGQPAPTTATAPVRDPKTGRHFLTRFDQPAAIRHHPTRSLAFVPARGTDNVLVLNTGWGDPARWPLGELQAGKAPVDVAFDAAGEHAYVLNDHDLTVQEFALAPMLATSSGGPGSIAFLPAPLFLQAVRTVTLGADPTPPLLAQGRRLFTHAGNPKLTSAGRVACASCHFEGRDDGLTWVVPLGPRQTPVLAGRVTDTEPYGWNGEHATLAAKVAHTVPSNLTGTGLDAGEIAALSAWLQQGLDAPAKAAPLTPQQQNGKILFEDPIVGCATCHTPEADFTDAGKYDLATATTTEKWLAANQDKTVVKLNPPSLRGLALSAPYLHHGGAATLLEALEATAATMGKTGQLTAAQKADLVAYLLTL